MLRLCLTLFGSLATVVYNHVVLQVDQLLVTIRHRYDEQIMAWTSVFGLPY